MKSFVLKLWVEVDLGRVPTYWSSHPIFHFLSIPNSERRGDIKWIYTGIWEKNHLTFHPVHCPCTGLWDGIRAELSCHSTALPPSSFTCQQHYCIWPWNKPWHIWQVFWKPMRHQRQQNVGERVGDEKNRTTEPWESSWTGLWVDVLRMVWNQRQKEQMEVKVLDFWP